jgi:hypothetical protein
MPAFNSDSFFVFHCRISCVASCRCWDIHPASFPWGSIKLFFYGVVLLASRPPPNSSARLSLFVWVITLDLSGIGCATSSICYHQHSSWDHMTTPAPTLRPSKDTFRGHISCQYLKNFSAMFIKYSLKYYKYSAWERDTCHSSTKHNQGLLHTNFKKHEYTCNVHYQLVRSH